MRKKLREIMDKEEGFTLVELLAVIVILGIILAIAIPSVGNLIDTAQGNANEAEQELAIDAGRLYFLTEEIADTVKSVPVSDLIDAGYMEPRGKENTVDKLKTKHTGKQITREKSKATGAVENAKEVYTYKYEAVSSGS